MEEYIIHAKFDISIIKIIEFLNMLKQMIAVVKARLKRYLNCSRKTKQNRPFVNNVNKFYI